MMYFKFLYESQLSEGEQLLFLNWKENNYQYITFFIRTIGLYNLCLLYFKDLYWGKIIVINENKFYSTKHIENICPK